MRLLNIWIASLGLCHLGFGAINVTIAQFDGSQAILASTYIVGTGSEGSANYAETAANYDYLGDDFVIKVTMGSVVDYYAPLEGDTLADMLTSNSSHLWSSSLEGTYVAPVYYSNPTIGLGGSEAGWPAAIVPSDDRQYLSFWGSNSGSLTGGGLSSTYTAGPASWGQAFSIDLISPVPEPKAYAFILGLASIAFIASKRCRRS